MLAVEAQAEPIYQVVDVNIGADRNAYKRLMLPVSDDGVDVTRVLISALHLNRDDTALAG